MQADRLRYGSKRHNHRGCPQLETATHVSGDALSTIFFYHRVCLDYSHVCKTSWIWLKCCEILVDVPTFFSALRFQLPFRIRNTDMIDLWYVWCRRVPCIRCPVTRFEAGSSYHRRTLLNCPESWRNSSWAIRLTLESIDGLKLTMHNLGIGSQIAFGFPMSQR